MAMSNSYESEVMKQLNYELNNQGPMEVESVQKIVESKFDIFRDTELKKYLHLVPYIYILVQLLATRKVPARIQEVRLLALTLLFQSTELKSGVEKSSSYSFSWGWKHTINYRHSLYAVFFTHNCYWLKFFTLISIIIFQQFIKEKKLAHRPIPFGLLKICHFATIDSMIILFALLPIGTLVYFCPLPLLGSWSKTLSIRAVIDLIECGNLFANFRLRGCDIDKNDIIGFGLTILVNTYDYRPRSIFAISFALYYICLGLLDKFRGWTIQVLKGRVPARLEASKNEVGDDNVQFLGDDRVLEYY